MRTLTIFFLYIIAIIGVMNTTSSWDEKRVVEALITEKWEDWSGEARNPYKVLFAVSITDPSGKNGLLPTIYYEKGVLGAHEWNKVVPGQTVREYKTSYRDLGVLPTEYQKKTDNWNSFFIFLIFAGLPLFAVLLLATWDGL